MGKVICVANQKGGVGKTTTVVNLGSSLAVLGKRTLLVDFDPQANTTSGVGIDKRYIRKTVYLSIIGEMELRDIIRPVLERPFGGLLHVAPSNPDLTGAEVELASEPDRENRLRDALMPLVDDYAYILIDCPPSLGLLTVNALCAAHSILVPIQCEYYAMEGLSDLDTTLTLLRERLNPALEIEGYLLTMFDPRNNLSHLILREVKEYFGGLVFDTVIPRNVRLAESPSYGLPAIVYDKKSSGAESYIALAEELIRRNGGGAEE